MTEKIVIQQVLFFHLSVDIYHIVERCIHAVTLTNNILECTRRRFSFVILIFHVLW
jgi:hypothetical protein